MSRPSIARRARCTLAVAMLTLVAACTGPLGPEQDELHAARARWESAGPADYTFDLQRVCFCGPDATREVRIVVMGGEAVSATYVETGEPVSDYPFGELPTIEDLFAEIQDAIDRKAHRLYAVYDPQLGFPTSVSIDYSPNIADEEMGFDVSSLDGTD